LQYLQRSILLATLAILLAMGAGAGIASADYDYFFTWGSHGTEAGQFDLPRGISLDQAGDVYVIDQVNNRTEVFSGDGEFLRQWGSPGSGDGEFNMPFGILVEDGKVYIVDRKNNRVQEFTQDGTYTAQFGTREPMPDVPFGPVAIAVNSSGYFFVGGTAGIQVFTPGMMYLTTWGSFGDGNDQVQVPFGLAFNSTGYLYTTDTLNCRVQVISPDGRFISRFGGKGEDPGQFFFPTGIAIDNQDNVFVADSNNDRIQVFDPSGSLITGWGERGSDPGQFGFVTGIAIMTRKNADRPIPELIYTADLENDRIQVFVAEEIPLIQDVDPSFGRSGVKNQLLRISGSGFLDGCTVLLEMSGQAPIVAEIRGAPRKDRIISMVNLTGATQGAWDVVVENPGGAKGRLPNAFLVR
jgi:hypothetical protein